MGKREKNERRFVKNTANAILLVMAIFIVVFITVMIVTYWRYQSVPDTLIQYTLGAGGIEAVLLAGIKVSKVIKGEHKDESE